MPPTRRARPSTGATQKPLAFKSKITKPTSNSSSIAALKDRDTELFSTGKKPVVDEVKTPEVKTPAVKTSEVTPTVKEENAVSRTPEEQQALAVSDTAIRRYWRDREAERLAKRVHQEGLSVGEKVLRLWDVSSMYGVSERDAS